MFRWIRSAVARRTVAATLGLTLLFTSSCSENLEDVKVEAETLFQAGKAEEAVALLRDAIRKDPSDGELQLAIGLALLQMGRPSEAIFPLSKAAESEELRSAAGLMLASTLLQAGNMEEAITAADRVLEADPENANAMVVRINAALHLHRGDIAIEGADRLLTLDPESPDFGQMRGLALVEADRLDEAEALFVELMDRAGEDDPERGARACLALAGALAEAKQEDRAVDRAKICEAEFSERHDIILSLVNVYDQLGMADDATEMLQRQVKAQPEAPQFRGRLGTRLIAADRFAEAEQVAAGIMEENETAQGLALVASVRAAAGNVEGALEAIDRAIELSETPDQEHLFQRADALIRLGDLDGAEAQQAEIIEPLYADIVQARLLHLRGRPQEALDLYEKVIALWPQNHGVRVFTALAALDVGDRKRARAELVEATRQAPKETDAALWLARLRFADGEYEGAGFMAQRQVNERGPTNPSAFVLAARAYARIGRLELAKTILASMMEVRDGLFKAGAVAELGRFSAQRGAPEKALGEYKKLIDKHQLDLADPASEPALAQLLEMMNRAGRLDSAARLVKRLVAAHPDRPILHAMQGRVALLQGNALAATAAVDRALGLDPSLSAGLAAKALIFHSQGDLAAASKAIDAAWKSEPNPDYAYMGARLQLDMGNAEVAQTRFFEFLRENPDHAPAANDLAWLLADRGESLEQAEEFARLALRLAPSAAVLDTLGYVQLKRGDFNAALGSFRRALDAEPKYATARYHLALALKEGGHMGEARENLETALETAFPESEEARAMLASLPGAATEGDVQ